MLKTGESRQCYNNEWNMGNKDIIIEKFVSESEMCACDKGKRKSCLMIALQNARILNGRDKDNGNPCTHILEKLDGLIEYDSFTVLANYLLILDMIGCVFANEEKVGKRINEVLERFGNIYRQERYTHRKYVEINEKDRRAICSLRNCLAHNYGLADGKEKIKFILSNSCNEMIVHPSMGWDGSYSTKNDSSTSTTINPQELINKIEDIYEEVKHQVLEGTLKTGLKDEELQSRFTIIID